MITNSQCERLKSMALKIKTTLEISKKDIGVKEILDISIALDLHELIKISILGEIVWINSRLRS